ncbi:hypothetical protein ACIPSA_48485 [Streptomyces sp. NPDC086549]|uniref:hypothetical protein n=1 Tax=Streptomyces sp. NPDC086549 TaxID=3365752 RepID=UPI0038016C71
MIDICSRRVVGGSIADRMRTRLVTDATEMGVAARGRLLSRRRGLQGHQPLLLFAVRVHLQAGIASSAASGNVCPVVM